MRYRWSEEIKVELNLEAWVDVNAHKAEPPVGAGLCLERDGTITVQVGRVIIPLSDLKSYMSKAQYEATVEYIDARIAEGKGVSE